MIFIVKFNFKFFINFDEHSQIWRGSISPGAGDEINTKCSNFCCKIRRNLICSVYFDIFKCHSVGKVNLHGLFSHVRNYDLKKYFLCVCLTLLHYLKHKNLLINHIVGSRCPTLWTQRPYMINGHRILSIGHQDPAILYMFLSMALNVIVK